MAVNQKPSLAARIFQGGGSAGLLGNPMFNIGMGLLAKGQDNRIPYATAVMSGLQNAQVARQGAQDREAAQAAAKRTATLEALQMQELLQRKQRDDLARAQYEKSINRMYPNLRPPMMDAGQPDPRAGLLRALGPDRVPDSVLKGLLGVTDPSDQTTDIQNFEFFRNLTPDEQRQYLLTKRAPQSVNFAGMDFRYDPVKQTMVAPDGSSIDEYEKKVLAATRRQGMQENELVRLREDLLAQADAQRKLPIAQVDVDAALTLIEELKIHPGLEDAAANLFIDPLPGTPGADFMAKLNQLNGQAFLNAFAALRGGGTITEIESEKATAALSSLALSQSAESLRDSLDTMGESLQRGIEKLRIEAGLPREDDDDAII